MEQHTKWYIGAVVLGVLTIPATFTIVLAPFTALGAMGCWMKGKKIETNGEWKPFWLPEDEESAPLWQKSFGQIYREWRGSDEADADAETSG